MTTNVNSLFSLIHVDLYPIIFKNLSYQLPEIALVCKLWQAVVDNEKFRDMIRPLRTMGTKELMKMNPNITDAGLENLLPRRAYRDLAETNGLLCFNPGKVKVITDKGEIKEVVLDSLEAIGNLFQAPNTNYKTVFSMDSWKPALQEKRKVEDPHWVWIDTKARGFRKSYEQQISEAKEEDKNAYPDRYEKGAQVSKLETGGTKQIIKIAKANDLALGLLMADVFLKERYFIWDQYTNQYTLIRVEDKIKNSNSDEWQGIAISFASSGLLVNDNYGLASKIVGYVCVRKSFGCDMKLCQVGEDVMDIEIENPATYF